MKILTLFFCFTTSAIYLKTEIHITTEQEIATNRISVVLYILKLRYHMQAEEDDSASVLYENHKMIAKPADCNIVIVYN